MAAAYSFEVMMLALAGVVPGFFSVGRLHVPVYGLFAAVGLVLALMLSQRTAARVGLGAESVWDAGVFGVVAAFVVSRLLLVMFNLRAFREYPLLVLALPSLTYSGMLLAGLAVWVYLRLKGLPWRDVLDAWAPCASVLAAVLQVAHFVEGTDAGMPTMLPWGVRAVGDGMLGRTHPVQVYAAVLHLLLAIALWRWLMRRRFAGEVAAAALVVGGVIAFGLGMLRQPVETFGDAWLDAGQWVGLVMMGVGAVLWSVCAAESARVKQSSVR